MKVKPLLTILLLAIFLVACGSAYLPAPTSTPVPSPQPTTTPDLTVDLKTLDAKTEDELVLFMLDYILQSRIDNNTSFVQTRGEPWLDAPESAIIISYSDANSDEPIKVWWYFDNQLIEATDNQIAWKKWNEYFVYNSPTHTWPDNIAFSILSLSNNNTKATIYYSLSTCSECAAAFLFTLERNAYGDWLIIKDETLWMG
jgi:hypothetical protein